MARALPMMKPSWGLPTHGLQHSNSCACLCFTPTTPLGTSHLSSNVQLHPQLLFSADGLSIQVTQPRASNCVQCYNIHRNFPKPAKIREAPDASLHVCGGSQAEAEPALQQLAQQLPRQPVPAKSLSPGTGVLCSHENAGASEVQGWGSSTNTTMFCSLVKVNENIKVPLKECHILSGFYLLACKLPVL